MNVAERTINLNIASDFTRSPGPRFRSEGKYSGEEFRETQLRPRFEQARREGIRLHVDLDGGYGYAPSFLEEAFGGLVREYGVGAVKGTLLLKSDEEPMLLDRIAAYLEKASA